MRHGRVPLDPVDKQRRSTRPTVTSVPLSLALLIGPPQTRVHAKSCGGRRRDGHVRRPRHAPPGTVRCGRPRGARRRWGRVHGRRGAAKIRPTSDRRSPPTSASPASPSSGTRTPARRRRTRSRTPSRRSTPASTRSSSSAASSAARRRRERIPPR